MPRRRSDNLAIGAVQEKNRGAHGAHRKGAADDALAARRCICGSRAQRDSERHHQRQGERRRPWTSPAGNSAHGPPRSASSVIARANAAPRPATLWRITAARCRCGKRPSNASASSIPVRPLVMDPISKRVDSWALTKENLVLGPTDRSITATATLFGRPCVSGRSPAERSASTRRGARRLTRTVSPRSRSSGARAQWWCSWPHRPARRPCVRCPSRRPGPLATRT
jgi:hypothetical protein